MTRRTVFILGLVLLVLPGIVIGQDTAPVAPVTDTTSTDAPLYLIPIHGEINPSLMIFVRRSIEKAKAAGARYIVFDIDTFGGRVDSALQITTLIGSIPETVTVAYVTVHPEGTGVSWSAGALIAFATNRIYMAPGTSIGSAAPVFQSPEGGMDMAPEKVVSAVRTQMAALAEKNGFPKGVALAMVDQEVELLEAHMDGKVLALTREEFDDLKRTSPDSVVEGRVISPSGKLLSLTAGEMLRYGISSGTVQGEAALYEALSVSPEHVVELSVSTADSAVGLITGAGVTSLLILVGLVALFMEITSPGFGLPGTVAILCFAVIFGGNFLLGTVGSVELLLFLAGVVLLVVEIFLIPGFGVTGISGIVLIGASLVFSMQDFVIPTFTWQWDILQRNLLIVFGNLLGAFVLFALIASMFRRSVLFHPLMLRVSETSDTGYIVQDTAEEARYLGRKGSTVTTLRPSGKAEFDGEIIAVEADGVFVPEGTPVEIVEVKGNRIIVRTA